jgi:hypothetical protein
MTLVNEMLASGESVGAISRADVDRPQAVASEAEIDALEYVVEEGRIACHEDYGVLRSWLCRLRPAWKSIHSEEATPGEGTSQGEGTSLQNGSPKGREMEHKEPVAWAILHKDHQYVSLCRKQAEAHNVYTDAEIVPLYAGPTLTDEERFVLREVRDIYADEDDAKCNEIAAVIDGLLERTKRSER